MGPNPIKPTPLDTTTRGAYRAPLRSGRHTISPCGKATGIFAAHTFEKGYRGNANQSISVGYSHVPTGATLWPSETHVRSTRATTQQRPVLPTRHREWVGRASARRGVHRHPRPALALVADGVSSIKIEQDMDLPSTLRQIEQAGKILIRWGSVYGDSSSGRTTDSGSVSRGSNPRSPTRRGTRRSGKRGAFV